MKNDFEHAEIHGLDNFRQIAQNILKKAYETERFKILGSVEQIYVDISKCVLKKIFPNNVGIDTFYQGAIQNQSRRDFHTNNLDLAYQSISKKINLIDTGKILEFLDTFSRKDLHGIVVPRVIVVKPIPKTEVIKATSKRIEVKLVPVKN